MMNVAVLGATKGMGRALARKMAARGDRLVLLGRNREELERSARDLEARGNLDAGAVGVALCDLRDRSSFAPALDEAERLLERLDCVVVTAADFARPEELDGNPARVERLLDVDFTGTVVFAEEARGRLLDQAERGGLGILCVFSSVAGERGRKPVALYGAAKAGLSYYLEAIDHRDWERGLRVVSVKPGFVKTSMTAGMDAPPFAGEPDQVATDVVKAIDRAARGRAGVLYTPWPWRWVMLVIRHLPRFVMRRVGF